MQTIQEAAASRLGVSVEQLCSVTRTAGLSSMRDAAMLASYRQCPQPSTREIGQAFGRTAPAVVFALRRALQAERRDVRFAGLVRELGTA